MLLKEWLWTRLFWRQLLVQVVVASWFPISRLISPGKAEDAEMSGQVSLGLSLSLVCLYVIGERIRFESPPGAGLLMLKASGGSRTVVPAKMLFDLPLLVVAMLPPVLLVTAGYDLVGPVDVLVIALLGLYLGTVGYFLGALSRLPIGVLVMMGVGIGSSMLLPQLGGGHEALLRTLCWVPVLGVYSQLSLILTYGGSYAPALVWMAVQGAVLLLISSFGLQRLLTRQLR